MDSANRSGTMASKTRAKLTLSDVLDIFRRRRTAPNAGVVSKQYGISEKAVRDIWSGRSWSRETWHLDTSRPMPANKIGRPMGSKDVKPRKKRGALDIAEISKDHPGVDDSQGLAPPNGPHTVKDWAASKSEQEPLSTRAPTQEEDGVGHARQLASIDELLFHFAPSSGFKDPFGRDWAAQRRILRQQSRL